MNGDYTDNNTSVTTSFIGMTIQTQNSIAEAMFRNQNYNTGHAITLL